MVWRLRLTAGLLLAGATLCAFAPDASAHALLQSSDPADGTQLTTAPEAVTLTFTEDPELVLSDVRVLDAGGRSFETGGIERVAEKARTIRIRVKDLERGVYTVAWRVVSRVDGHATGGAFAFGVGVAPTDAPVPTIPGERPPTISGEEVAGRVLLYIGLVALIGTAWVSAAAFRTAPNGAVDLARIAWAAAIIGVAYLGSAQRRAAAVGLGDLLATDIGRALIWRAAVVLVAGIAIFVGSRLHDRGKRIALTVAGLAAAGALFAHVEAGHAAAAESAWRNVAFQWIHVTAVGVWVGGLAALLMGIRGAPDEEKTRAVRRFSFAAGITLFIVAATGTVRALDEVGSWDALTTTTYGRLVIAKASLIVALGVLGAVNRYRNVPRASGNLSRLRFVSRAELVLAALALGAAAGLASLAPPATASSSQEVQRTRPIVVTGSDFARTIRVRLEVSPGFAGSNLFSLRVVRRPDGSPLDATRVALRFRFTGDQSIGETELELSRSDRGTYSARGGNLSLDGRWEVTAIVQRATDSFEIPLQVLTRCRAEPIPVAGGPTLYTMQVAVGTAQGYADPGTAGSNEVHVTFFDVAGKELPIEAFPSIVASSAAAADRTFQVRRFGPGHFVADAALSAGRYRFSFAGVAPSGDPLRGCFEETIR